MPQIGAMMLDAATKQDYIWSGKRWVPVEEFRFDTLTVDESGTRLVTNGHTEIIVNEETEMSKTGEVCANCGLTVDCGLDLDRLCCACDGQGMVCDSRILLGKTDETMRRLRDEKARDREIIEAAAKATASINDFAASIYGAMSTSASAVVTAATPDPPAPKKRDTRPLEERLPELGGGRFWRVTKRDRIGKYEVHLREKRWYGSKKITEGFIEAKDISDDAIVDMADWVLEREVFERGLLVDNLLQKEKDRQKRVVARKTQKTQKQTGDNYAGEYRRKL